MQRRGGRLIAVSVDPPADSARVVRNSGLSFPILCDKDRSVITMLDLVHPGGGPGGADVPIPANILLDRNGRIIWKHVARRIPDRFDPARVLSIVREKLNQADGTLDG